MSVQKNYTSAISFIILLFAIYWSINSLMPNRISDLETPKTEFSTTRALVHLKEISKEPHFVGTQNHEEVRNYIVKELEKLGLTVEVQTQIAINKKWRAGSTTKNILARIKGTENGKALLILTHYDSAVHSSYGASDAGSGVVTILEGIRAFLATNKTHKNDIIILISDAEEIGLLGANAFVKHHPWAKDVGLVLNFEARGSGGPSYMLLETNGGNKNLIHGFNDAKPKYPVANSLLYSIYKMLPNDTDLTVFREEGNINGFNFAFIDDHYDYHTAQDNYERLDRNTLQQQGEYLMPLIHHFSNTNLENLSAQEDDVFFDFPGTILVNYPFSWVLPMVILASILFLIFIFIGFKNNKLSGKEIFKGLFIFLFSFILSGFFTFFGWKLLLKIYPQYNDILHGFTYNGNYYITGFVALALGITFWIYNTYFKTHKAENLIVAPIFIWLLINIGIALYLPGAGFFIIPVFIGLLILSILIFSKETAKNKIILYSFLVIPVLIIFIPLIQMFPVGLGLKMTVISAIFTVLIFGILIPIFAYYKKNKSLAKLFFIIAVLAFVSASFSSGYSIKRKQPNSILYFFDADTNKAYWASYNTKVDEFTKQFLGDDPTKGTFIKDISSSKYGTNFKMYNNAELINISQPEIEILKDTLIGENRSIHFKIIPQRKINRIELKSNNPLHFKELTLNGETLEKKENENFIFHTEEKNQILTYYFTKNDSILDIKFVISNTEIPDLEIIEASYDLYKNNAINNIKSNIELRNEVMIPTPFVLNDAVVVKKDIKFNQQN
ncbi:MAG: M28 family peptidase [Bacteroidota bacterium]